MGIIGQLIEQAKKPNGFVGKTMLSIMNSAHNGLMQWGLEKITLKENDIVLDIGCGGGELIKKIAHSMKAGKIYGIDYSETAVQNSIKKNKKDVAAGKVEVVKASVSAIPFSNEFFGLITAFQTHYFWPDLKNDLKEVYRVLKTDGKIIIVAELYKINYHMKSYKTKEELENLFNQIGFKRVRFYQNKKCLSIIGTK